MKTDFIRAVLIALSLVVLTACGQTGPLVLPGTQAESEQPEAEEDESEQ